MAELICEVSIDRQTDRQTVRQTDTRQRDDNTLSASLKGNKALKVQDRLFYSIGIITEKYVQILACTNPKRGLHKTNMLAKFHQNPSRGSIVSVRKPPTQPSH